MDSNEPCKSINTAWNLHEELAFLILHTKYGNHWNQIACDFKGWSTNQLKNHFYSSLRKCVRKITKKEYECANNIDFLQNCYVAEVLTKYFEAPKRQRKKNYLHRLIVSEKVNSDAVHQFRMILHNQHPMLFNKLLEYGVQRFLPSLPSIDAPLALNKEEKLSFICLWLYDQYIVKE